MEVDKKTAEGLKKIFYLAAIKTIREIYSDFLNGIHIDSDDRASYYCAKSDIYKFRSEIVRGSNPSLADKLSKKAENAWNEMYEY